MMNHVETIEPTHVVVVGAKGMLGRAWCALLAEWGIECEPLDLPEFDVLSAGHVARAISGRTDLIVNCAAWTDVDGAEDHETGAWQLNVEAVALLAGRAKASGARLIHYSTDYVFDGSGVMPWPVDAPRNPLNVYGRSKAAGEMRLIESGCDFLLVRTSWLYAPWAKNFVLTIGKLAAEREWLQVVNDQFGRPTSAQHLAKSSLALAMRKIGGVRHVTDGGSCSWFELAQYIVEQTGANCTVDPCQTKDMPRPAARPANSVLDISLTEQSLGPMPHWREHVAAALRDAGLASAPA